MDFDFKSDSEKNPLSFLFHDTSDKIFKIQGGGLSVLTVDTVDRENHDWSNDISDYPVEGTANISDNIKQRPDKISFTCFVSNTPIEGLVDEVTHLTDRFLNGRKRTQDAYNQLLALKNLRIPVTVTTRYRVYENVAIESVSIPREPDNGDSLIFTVTLKEINIVSTQMVKVPEGIGRAGAQAGNSAKTRAAVKVDAGKSTGRKVSPDIKAAIKEGEKSKVLTRRQSVLNSVANELAKHGIPREATTAIVGSLTAGAGATSSAVKP